MPTNSQLPISFFSRGLKPLYDFLKRGPSLVNDYELITTGASAKTLNKNVYGALITSGGTAGNETLNIGNGSGATPGQRKFVKLVTRTDASDAVVLDHANIVLADNTTGASSVVLNAANEFILLEWNGAKWRAVYFTAGVAA